MPDEAPAHSDPSASESRAWHRVFAKTRNTFIAGLVVVIPLVGTLFLLGLFLKFIDVVMVDTLRLRALIGHHNFLGVRLIPLLILLAVIFLVGMVATHAIGRRLFDIFDWLVSKVPMVSTIYSAFKQVMDTLRGFEGTRNFQYVAYVDFPAPGCRLIAFVTGRFTEPGTGKSITCVFLPTTPNPITGYTLAVETEKVVPCPLSVEEATKLIVSGGLVGLSPAPGKTPPPTPLPAQPEPALEVR